MDSKPFSSAAPATLLLLTGLLISVTGCGPRDATPPAVSAPASPGAQDAKPEPVPTPSVASAPAAPSATPKAVPVPATKPVAAAPAASPAPVMTQAPAPAPAPETKATPPAPKPAAAAPAASPVSDPGGEVAVKPMKAGLSKVGTASCKMCHRVQFASWTETAHGKRTPPLDCEGCHGAGSEYKAITVMKDPAKAKAAGLVVPDAAFCATCHKRNWNDGMLKKAHAHKP